MFTFLDVPVAALNQVFQLFSGVLGAGLAIVAVTLAVRLLLHPLARAAARGQRARTALAPRVRELRHRYGKDPQRLRRELEALHRESDTPMFAGCLPILVQMPFFVVLFRLFSSPVVDGEPNGLLSHAVFGIPLGAHWTTATTHPVFLVLFAALAAVAWCSVRLTPNDQDVPKPLRLLPFGSVLGAAVLPLAAGIYLLVSTAWGVAERTYLHH
jgi:YidC/Oxa1 family membrane protein insertase